MKRFLTILLASIFAVGCSNETKSPESSSATTDSSTEKIDYAYLPNNHPPDNWSPGDQKNVALALKTLKAYETGDIEGSLAGFADSVRWTVDRYDAKISKDSLRAMFKQSWNNLSSIKIKMDDYESVISKDKKQEWVTMWYTQISTDKAGKVDSVAYVDDLKFVNGKIALLDEKGRLFPIKK